MVEDSAPLLELDDDVRAALLALALTLNRAVRGPMRALVAVVERRWPVGVAVDREALRSLPEYQAFAAAFVRAWDAYAGRAALLIGAGQLAAGERAAQATGVAPGVVATPLRVVLDGVGRDTAAALVRELSGESPAGGPRLSPVDRLTAVVGAGVMRVLTVARSTIVATYREGLLAGYQAMADPPTGWWWKSRLSPTTCAVCYARHGSVHRLDEPFVSHPSCFPAGTLVSAPPVLASSERWYDGQLVEIETTHGHFVAVTPNHPILTPQGWVAAGLLDEGDDIISSADPEIVVATIDPYHDHVPALIEDVAHAFGGTSPMLTRGVPLTTEDFHGDGGGSKVCVIRSDRLLFDRLDPTFDQPLAKEVFGRRAIAPPSLTCDCGATLALEWHRTATVRSLGSLGVLPMLFRSAALHHKSVRFTGGAWGDIGRYQPGADTRARYAIGGGQRVLGFPGPIAGDDRSVGEPLSCPRGCAAFYRGKSPLSGAVAEDPTLLEDVGERLLADVPASRDTLDTLAANIRRDRVRKIGRRQFHGHVYNLQTTAGWYSANGIIAHNCRCIPVPLGRGAARPKTGEAHFARLPAEQQRAILGPGKADLFANGSLRLDDLVAKTAHPLYGPGLRERSLRELGA